MGKNTNWCTKAKEVAEKYLKQGPLYLILMDGEKVGQVHFESQEVKDLDDKPIVPETGLLRKLLKAVGERYYYLFEWLTEKEELIFAKLLLKRVSEGEMVHVDNWDEICSTGILSDTELRLFAADCAERVLHYFESDSPKDLRPRQAIETARKFALGQATQAQLGAADSAAWDSAISVRGSAHYAAKASAESATLAAADASSWACKTSRWAVWFANLSPISAESAELAWQQQHFLKIYQGLYRHLLS